MSSFSDFSFSKLCSETEGKFTFLQFLSFYLAKGFSSVEQRELDFLKVRFRRLRPALVGHSSRRIRRLLEALSESRREATRLNLATDGF